MRPGRARPTLTANDPPAVTAMSSRRSPAADPIHRSVAVLGTLVLAVALTGLWRAVEAPPPAPAAPAVSTAPEAGATAPEAPRG